jgi:hypothetical protein
LDGDGETFGEGDGEGVGLATLLARALLDVGRLGAAMPDGLMLAK